ncbi:hypothetical protein CR513_00785, partial [Mucuna pruriens]
MGWCIELPEHTTPRQIAKLKSSSNILYELDPEIDRNLSRLRKVMNTVVSNSSSSNSASNSNNSVSVTNDSNFSEYSSSNINSDCNFGLSNFQESKPMENNDRTLKELGMPNVCPQLEPAQSDELKSRLIHLLPKFHDPAGEYPHKHLKEFHVVYSRMRLQWIPKDYFKMKLVLFDTWEDMKHMLHEKFFPASRTATIRKEICGIRQHSRETLHEYWE